MPILRPRDACLIFFPMAGLAFHQRSMPVLPALDREHMRTAPIALSGIISDGVTVQAARMGQHAFDLGPLGQTAKKITHNLLTVRRKRRKHESTKPGQPTRKEQLTATALPYTSQTDPPMPILLNPGSQTGRIVL